ncbi:hypothetical protein SDC9_174052 [bioreactor metagenome]|uniref:Uncharacterized protein n=1 Tax=bioreactor metagenome TaxID=1076179 RepID=A0A645GI60_9ZZZZ
MAPHGPSEDVGSVDGKVIQERGDIIDHILSPERAVVLRGPCPPVVEHDHLVLLGQDRDERAIEVDVSSESSDEHDRLPVPLSAVTKLNTINFRSRHLIAETQMMPL